MNGVTKFYEFTPYQETGNWVETGERTNCNTVVTQTLTGIFPCHAQDMKEAIDELKACCCGFVVIHEENNGHVGFGAYLNLYLIMAFTSLLN
jgi:hypothetical protein